MHFSVQSPPPALAPWVKTIWRAHGVREEFAAAEPIAAAMAAYLTLLCTRRAPEGGPLGDDRKAQKVKLATVWVHLATPRAVIAPSSEP